MKWSEFPAERRARLVEWLFKEALLEDEESKQDSDGDIIRAAALALSSEREHQRESVVAIVAAMDELTHGFDAAIHDPVMLMLAKDATKEIRATIVALAPEP